MIKTFIIKFLLWMEKFEFCLDKFGWFLKLYTRLQQIYKLNVAIMVFTQADWMMLRG